jgi:hypothetical protein
MTLMPIVRHKGEEHTWLREPGECSGCDAGWEQLKVDTRQDENFNRAWELRSKVRRYVSGYPGCTIEDLKARLYCPDVVLRICLHFLVDDFELSGPDPYACGVPTGHPETSTYRVLHLPGPPSE